jgi:hypothetical protein
LWTGSAVGVVAFGASKWGVLVAELLGSRCWVLRCVVAAGLRYFPFFLSLSLESLVGPLFC